MTATLNERPSLEEARRAELKSSASLGVFTTVALIGLLWGFCWLKSFSPFSNPQRFNVIFREVAGLVENAGVYVDGVRVGMVEKIDWQSEHRVVARVRMVSDDVTVPAGSKFTILTNGIVGAKYLEIAFPHLAPTQEAPPPIPNNSEVIGEDPVRPELAVNNLAIGLSKIDMDELRRTLSEDRERLIRVTDEMSILANKSMPVIDKALPLENEVLALSKDMRVITRKLSKLVDDPNLSRDLKETVVQAKQTMTKVQATMHELNVTISDKTIRRDLLAAIDKLNTSAEHIQASAETVQKIAGDKELRADVKEVLREARSAMAKVDELFSSPEYGTDLRETLSKTRSAVDNVDKVSRQLSQMLDKRHPLLHMIFGRPGHLKNAAKKDKVEAKVKDKVDKAVENAVDKAEEKIEDKI